MKAEAPEGLLAVTCSRCRTRQNVPLVQGTYECWQCHNTETLLAGRVTR